MGVTKSQYTRIPLNEDIEVQIGKINWLPDGCILRGKIHDLFIHKDTPGYQHIKRDHKVIFKFENDKVVSISLPRSNVMRINITNFTRLRENCYEYETSHGKLLCSQFIPVGDHKIAITGLRKKISIFYKMLDVKYIYGIYKDGKWQYYDPP